MARVLWTPTGRESLVKIGRYIVEQSQSVDRGVKVIDQIEDKCRLYAGFPEAGTARDDLGKGLRCFPVGNFVVIYRPLDNGIRVIVVAHGHQDLYVLLRGLPESDL